MKLAWLSRCLRQLRIARIRIREPLALGLLALGQGDLARHSKSPNSKHCDLRTSASRHSASRHSASRHSGSRGSGSRRSARTRFLGIQTLETRRVLASVVVNTLADIVDETDPFVSIREAVELVSGISENSTISFQPDLFPDDAKQTIDLIGGTLSISSDHSIEFLGPGSQRLSLSGRETARVIDFSGLGNLNVSGMEITRGVSFGLNEHGGGLRFDSTGNLRADDMVFLNNRTSSNASSGGGLALLGGGSAIVSHSEFIANRTTGTSSHGGGIYVEGHLDLTGTYFSVNQTLGNGANGGGIYASDPDETRTHSLDGITLLSNATQSLGGSIYVDSSAILTNVTASGGRATGFGQGGNIFLAQPASIPATYQIRSSTIIGGRADRGGGIFIESDPTNVSIANSIIAQNSTAISSHGPDIGGGEIVTASPSVQASLIGEASGTLLMPAFGDSDGNLIGDPASPLDPMLGFLTENGGAVRTHPPLQGSPVINAGNNALATVTDNPIMFDGRGTPYLRISAPDTSPGDEAIIDMGAHERQPVITPIIRWPRPENILVGTPLSSAQLNATANADGQLFYQPGDGLVLGEGARTMTVFFTPDDPSTVHSASTSVTIQVVAPADYGDAPESYGTRFLDDGPMHRVSDLFLGESVVYGADANPDRGELADSDSDDNGVVFQTSLVASDISSTIATISVEATDAAMLDAWIDFDGDGAFSDNEHLFGDSLAILAGDNRIPFAIPLGATAGQTYARFRLSSVGDLGPGGVAVDGEVEDYLVTLLDGSSPIDQTIDVPGNLISLVRDSDELVGRRRGEIIYRVPFDSINRFTVLADAFSGVLELDQSFGSTVPVGGLRYNGRGLIDTLRIIGPLDTIDLTVGSLWDLIGVEAIDLTDASAATTAIVDAATIAAIDVDRGGLVITGESSDQFVIADPSNWIGGEPYLLIDEVFASIESTETFVQTNINVGNGWHNLIDASDIDNSGTTSPVDALLIINELRRQTYFDSATGILVPVDQADPFPGLYFDQNDDGRISPIDALAVINDLRRRRNADSESGESLVVRDAVAALVPLGSEASNDISSPIKGFVADEIKKKSPAS